MPYFYINCLRLDRCHQIKQRLKKEAEVRCRGLQRDKVSLFLYDILSLSAGGIAKKMQTKKERMIPFLSSRNHYFL
ncbi:transcriptional regulator [Bacillus licheniformis]|nr:transcriptional regulator [Bacillus licheniformis]OJT70268.1 transcriptional regulator [Bacillus licheniformis]